MTTHATSSRLSKARRVILLLAMAVAASGCAGSEQPAGPYLRRVSLQDGELTLERCGRDGVCGPAGTGVPTAPFVEAGCCPLAVIPSARDDALLAGSLYSHLAVDGAIALGGNGWFSVTQALQRDVCQSGPRFHGWTAGEDPGSDALVVNCVEAYTSSSGLLATMVVDVHRQQARALARSTRREATLRALAPNGVDGISCAQENGFRPHWMEVDLGAGLVDRGPIDGLDSCLDVSRSTWAPPNRLVTLRRAQVVGCRWGGSTVEVVAPGGTSRLVAAATPPAGEGPCTGPDGVRGIDPSGRWLAGWSTDERWLHLIDLEAEESTVVACPRPPQGHGPRPLSWGPDAEHLAVLCERENGTHLEVWGPPPGLPLRFSMPLDVTTWTDLEWEEDGRWLLVRQQLWTGSPQELVLVDVEEGRADRLELSELELERAIGWEHPVPQFGGIAADSTIPRVWTSIDVWH